MKLLPLVPVSVCLAFVACDTMTAPVSSSSFDPLTPPGSGRTLSTVGSASAFTPGQFVRASMDSTAFFHRRPRGDADADKLLPRNTNMKVVSTDASYVKVELDSGEVGFVPTVMVEDPSSAAPAMNPANPNEYQVYPPVAPPNDGLGTLPVFETDGLPPEGAFPEVTDPEMPATDATAADAADSTLPPEVPAAPESTPLPPTTPELEAEALKETDTAGEADATE